ncbi:MAG: hypothetical protein RLN76_07065 [Phycisphaeraceae bacterium]
MTTKQKKRDGKKKKNKPDGPTKAQRADKYDLYQKAVQDPEHEVDFFELAYREANEGASPTTLREDFCGTFAICCSWAASKPDRRSLGVDLDPEPLDWGVAHNLTKLNPEQQSRITLLKDDVRKITQTKADVLSAQNFSFYLFTERKDLVNYFKAARENLAPGGVMVLDMMGGPDCLKEDNDEPRKCDGFHYTWRTESVNPITNISSHTISFKFKDGSKLRNAFTYQWRMYSIPEVRDALLDAGFPRVDVYWEGATEDGDGDGDWKITTEAEMDPSWLCYMVARRDLQPVGKLNGKTAR